MISMLSAPGDIVMDPFSGRGTTLLEARLLGRVPIVSDLNPIAIALSRAKSVVVNNTTILNRIDALRDGYDKLLHLPEAQVQSDDIQLIYHPQTLAQLCYLRRQLIFSEVPEDQFLVGALLGVMHGSERQDGSSGYASISMPNTFSMSPNYVRRFVETNRLNRTPRDVFKILSDKVGRLFRDEPPPATHTGVVFTADTKRLAEYPDMQEYLGRVKLIITSPPYLDVVNYAKQNWIRNWLLQPHYNTVHANELDDNLTLKQWLDFAESVVEHLKRFLVPGGVLAFVVGDVAKPTRGHISLAREFIQRLLHDGLFSYVGCLDDHIGHEIKTTRIWKETKGRATEIDRIIVLSDSIPSFRADTLYNIFGTQLTLEDTAFTIDPIRLADSAKSFAGVSADFSEAV